MSELQSLRPVFVVGSPRSGTTLIQTVVSAHAEFWTVPETHLFSAVLVRHPALETHRFTPKELVTIQNRLLKRSGIILPKPAADLLHSQSVEGTLDAAGLLNVVMSGLKPADDPATRWLEKSPEHVLHLNRIWNIFPRARIVNVLRDPRDVVSSPKRFRRHGPGPARLHAVVKIAMRWNRFIEAADAHEADERLLMVRYEDFITDPAGVLRRVAAHVGVTPDLTALHRFSQKIGQATRADRAEMKALNAAPGLIDRRAIWKERFTEQEARVTEEICGPLMTRHGYARAFPRHPKVVMQVRWWTVSRSAARTFRRYKGQVRRTLKRAGR